MPFSGMWRRVGLVRTDVLEQLVASIFRYKNPLAIDLGCFGKDSMDFS
jgi:hypothetical protein